MTNIGSKARNVLSDLHWRVGIQVETAFAGVTHRYLLHEACGVLSVTADKVEEFARDRTERFDMWRTYMATARAANFLHDAWVLTGRSWESRVELKFPNPDRKLFFLAAGGPETSTEASARSVEECARAHRW